ncbi:MAG: ATP phosphoribosyltransferase regulatory subunit [Nitrospinaceae bacterium]|jgi:ATP phosphoribosyltransferase regulatory subunit|nr:ATP phosphoribosyltransferase regulatory subunit [Nitrospinaceae bacterium]MBT5368909.1 ATP phosphoribosyltransferase regulatory subunit [Nitrospinaceae bacterium]MBT5947896.1 ATP phosphoribosyltransferase regulatory subunit [Nitrospinaceae bacterium]
MDSEKTTKALPKGSKVFLPDQAEKKRRVESRLLEVFARWGFRQIVTPAFDVFTSGNGGQIRDSQTFRLVDMDTGGLLALRSDVTPQIAQLAGGMLSEHPRPLRLSYVTNVFRHAHVGGLLQREFWQAGVELIGLVSLEADVEMIAIAMECLEQNGVENVQMSLSHSAFIRGLLDAMKLEEGPRKDVLDAVSRRDASGLEGLVGKFASKGSDARVLLDLPEFFGGKKILDRALGKVKNPLSRRAVEELMQVENMLELYGLADQVIFDLSDFRGFDYYTGVLFEGFVEGSGYPVCGGGRYDSLLGRYGTDALGTGIAIDVDQLLQVVPNGEPEGLGGDFLVIDFTKDKRVGIQVARELRAAGWRVARDIIRRGLPDSLEYARRAGVSRCIVVEREGSRKGSFRVMDPSGDEMANVKVNELKAWVEGLER